MTYLGAVVLEFSSKELEPEAGNECGMPSGLDVIARFSWI
jgi:hypothetical protein